MEISELIDRCCQHEDQAWADLWEIVSDAARCPVRQLLQRHGFDPSLADDVIQEFYLRLQADGLRRLHSFHGTSELEFRSFLRSAVLRLAQDRLRQWQHRFQQHEVEALGQYGLADRSGPTEHDIEAAIRELDSRVNDTDRPKLRAVLRAQGLWKEATAGDEASLPPCSARTLRRYRRELMEGYGKWIV